jgi:hypothetical protein
MKQGQRAHLGSMEKKRDTMQRRGDNDQRRGSTEKGGDDANLVDVNFTGLKNKENLHSRFSCYK